MKGEPSFAALLEGFFTQRLMQQRHASAHTIASYRDTFRLLMQFIQRRLHKAPSALALGDIDAENHSGRQISRCSRTRAAAD